MTKSPKQLEIWQEQQDLMTDSMNSMRKSQFLTDLVIVCDGTEIPVHRTVLCAASPFFQNVFKSESKESLQGRLELPSINLQTAEMILDFLYTGKIQNELKDRELLKDLAEASNLLQLNALLRYCLLQLGDFLSESEFLEFWKLGTLYNDEELQQKVIQFIADNFFEISSTPDFCNLSASQLLQVLQSTSLNVWAEFTILNGVMTWIQFNSKERSCELERMLQLIDIKHVSEERLKVCLDYAYRVKNSSVISTLLATLFQSYFDFVVGEEYVVKSCEKNYEPKLLIFNQIEEHNALRTYNVCQKTLSAATILPRELQLQNDMAVVVCNDDVYFFGGEVEVVDARYKVYKYSPQKNVSTSLRDLAVGMSAAGAALLGNHIYIIGGLDKESKPQRIVQRYDVLNETVKVVSSTKYDHTNPLVFTFEDSLYAFGSFEKTENAVEKYNTGVDQWTVITWVPGVVDDCVSTFCGQKLFVVRNTMLQPKLEINLFDLSSSKWDVKYVRKGPYEACSMWAVSPRCIIILDEPGGLFLYDVVTEMCKETGHTLDSAIWNVVAVVK